MFRTIGLLAGLIIPCTCLTAQQVPLKDLSLARFENLVEGYGGGGTGTHAQHYFSYTGQKVQSSWSYAKVNASDSFVEWTTGIQIPQISAESSVLMAIAGGIAPDVLEFSQNTLYNYVQQGFLLPLDDMIGQMDPQQMSQRAPLQAWEAARIVGPDGKRHYYAIPNSYWVSCLKIRRDLAARHGFSRDKLPRTWDELYEMAQAVSSPHDGRYGVGLPKGQWLAGFQAPDDNQGF